MEFQVQGFIVNEAVKKFKNDEIERELRYLRDSSRKLTLNTMDLTDREIKVFADLTEKYYNDNVPDKDDKVTHNRYYPFLNLSRKLNSILDVSESDGITGKMKNLEQFATAIKTYFKDKPHKMIFIRNTDGMLLPWIVTDIRHDKGGRGQRPYVYMTWHAIRRGAIKQASHSWYMIRGKTIEALFKEAKIVPETPELITEYVDTYKKFVQKRFNLGEQVHFGDIGYLDSGRRVPLTIDGQMTKAVIDDESDDIENDSITSEERSKRHYPIWRDQDIRPLDIFARFLEASADEEIDEEDGKQYTILPPHPYIKGFDLGKHRFITTHINNIHDYKWNKTLADKLVLEEETKGLIEILVNSTRERSEDIIAGKMSGTIVLATGLPGVGKTLTAEVFSEYIEKSLYVVQCSQLGISVTDIESNLKKVLDRASRWGSILLIDEADVYIRDRGEDIVHNAIVGVFLRLIEYYNGVLFMTSNRGDIIDDAIISRATAWIKYETPSPGLLKRIWQVLSTQYEVKIGDKEIDQLVEKIPDISGRTVRNILKLVKSLDYESVPEKDLPKENLKRLINASKYQKLS